MLPLSGIMSGRRILRIFTSISLALGLVMLGGDIALSADAAKSATASKVATQYQTDLRAILMELKKQLGDVKFYIAGGTAQSLVRSSILGESFKFRDFDLVITAETAVSLDAAQRLGKALQKNGLGRFSIENLRPRPRFNPDLKDPKAAMSYNAGYGFFLEANNGTEYDISLFHSERALSLNGILDVDRVRIAFDENTNLDSLFTNQLELKKHLIDPEGALDAVLSKRQPRISNWMDVEKSPAMTSIRIVRAMSKYNSLPLDSWTRQKMKKLIQDSSESESNSLQIARNFLKLFADADWHREAQELAELGVFSKEFRSFTKSIQDLNFNSTVKTVNTLERAFLILKDSETEDALHFLKILGAVEPESVDFLLPKLIEHKKLKIGYFTGEFAPFHRGHEGVARSALQSREVDLVFILPTPHARNFPMTKKFSPVEWKERIEFVRSGTNASNRIWVYPTTSTDITEIRKLQPLIDSLQSYVQGHTLTHILGMDSYIRAADGDLFVRDPRPRLVVTRPGIEIPKNIPYENIKVIPNLYEQPVSSTRILHEVAMKQSSSDTFSQTQKLLMQTPRYQQKIRKLQRLRQEIEERWQPIKDLSDKTLVWFLNRNMAGLADYEYPHFSKAHEDIFLQLMNLDPKRIVIAMKGTDEAAVNARAEWKGKLRAFANVQIEAGPLPSADEFRIDVVHSGTVNEHLGKVLQRLNSTEWKSLIVYEIDPQPVSPLVEGVDSVLILKSDGAETESAVRACTRSLLAG